MAETLRIRNTEVKERHPFGPLGLTIVTLGIYLFFWWYQINREMRDLGADVDPAKSVLAVTIGWLIIAPPFISVFNTAQRIQRTQEKTGLGKTGAAEGEMISGLALVLAIVPVASLLFQAYLQNALNIAYRRMAQA